MRSAWVRAMLPFALIGCGSSAGASGAGAAGTLVAGTYAGTATTADCVGFPGATCPWQITISGSGPTYPVTDFMLPGGISGNGINVILRGGNVTVDLVTASTVDFCPKTEYSGSGTVGADGKSMSVTLTGLPCGSSDTVFISGPLTNQ